MTPHPLSQSRQMAATIRFIAERKNTVAPRAQSVGVDPLSSTDTRFSVLIVCEYSATVRDAFRARGFDAWSNDILPTEGDPRWHIQGDCRDAIKSRYWDLIIMHVPCTAMAVCGNSTYGTGKAKHGERLEAIRWTVETARLALQQAPCVALENGASVIFPVLRNKLGADVQYAHPWQHGHPEQKKTGLALWGLPRLTETANVHAEMMELPRHIRERVHFMSPGPERGKERARFYPGFAAAMADQWGDHIKQSRSDLPAAGAGDQANLPAASASQGGGLCDVQRPFHGERYDNLA